MTASATVRLLRCSQCGRSLSATAREFRCEACARCWPVEDGVGYFGGGDCRRHALTPAQRQEIAAVAVTAGWQVALHDHLRALNPRVYRRAADEYRAQWRFVLPLTPSSRVLDLNSEWGAVAVNLAESCALVVAADACPALARFIGARAQQMGLSNLIPLHLGLDQPLPVADAGFDAVVLVGALSELRDTATQRRLLRRARAALKPGGHLFLADANRLAPTSLPGRWARGRGRTLWGYRSLLRAAGFRTMRVYAPLPSHLEPFFMVPLDRRAPLTYLLRDIILSQDFSAQVRRRGPATLYRLACAVGRGVPLDLLTLLMPPFVPSVAIVAPA